MSDEEEYEVETIISKRSRKGKVGEHTSCLINISSLFSRFKVEYLVKWKGYSLEDSTWEPASNLTGCQDLVRQYKSKAGLNQTESATVMVVPTETGRDTGKRRRTAEPGPPSPTPMHADRDDSDADATALARNRTL